jgi:hypothetical protein
MIWKYRNLYKFTGDLNSLYSVPIIEAADNQTKSILQGENR